MTQEFAKTQVLGKPGKICPHSFPRKNRKKLAFFIIFVLLSFLKKKTISYHPLVITTAAQSRLIVIGSNGTRGFYADPYNTT